MLKGLSLRDSSLKLTWVAGNYKKSNISLYNTIDCIFYEISVSGDIDYVECMFLGFEFVVVHSDCDTSISLFSGFVDDPGVFESSFFPILCLTCEFLQILFADCICKIKQVSYKC